ncbi:Bug family tripartite tricarboxylate transporter substrate binding protein [Cupriavidus sp. 8B]
MIRGPLAAAVAAACILSALPAHAETFPARPVRLLSPFPAGSGPDAVSRMIGDRLGRDWNQPVIVDARPGGNGFIAMEATRRSPATGYELGIADVGHLAINPSLFKKLPYDPVKDYVPVTGLYRTAFFVVVSSHSPIKSIPALLSAAKAGPNVVSYGSWAVGSPGHLGAAQLEAATGTQMLHAPFKDTAQLYTAVANGEVTWALGSYATAGPLIQAGKLRVLAVADHKRSIALPEVPTIEEAGGPRGIEASTWVALLAPAGTPPERVSAIGKAVREALDTPEVKAKMATFGFVPAGSTGEQVSEWMRKDTPRYADMVKRTGATIN